MATEPQPRFVKPCRQPVCCNCGHWREAQQTEDFTFACPVCRLYVGYCGPNGCDTGVVHTCWKPGDVAPACATPDYFNADAYQRATMIYDRASAYNRLGGSERMN